MIYDSTSFGNQHYNHIGMKFNTVEEVKSAYCMEAWGETYFELTENGDVCVSPQGNNSKYSTTLLDIINQAQSHRHELPLLIRFPQIIHDKIKTIHQAFKIARTEYDYSGEYQCVYPIKVNQEKQVIETILDFKKSPMGLEVGSRAELMTALLALTQRNETGLIVINGYKDAELIQLGLIAQELGHEPIFIIEKLHELDLIIEQAKKLNAHPKLGVRIRLNSASKGKWQNTGGTKSKFGLTIADTIELIAKLKDQKFLDHLQVLHCHLGSQISDLEDLIKGMQELARHYQQLVSLNVPITTVDVGGGLAVDYEGKKNRDNFSMNYSVHDYADVIVKTLANVCEQFQIPTPNIITESGRAMTAHHAVLVADVIHQESSVSDFTSIAEEPSELLNQLFDLHEQLTPETISKLLPKLLALDETLHTAYLLNELTLPQKASCEAQVQQIYQKAYPILAIDNTIEPLQVASIRERLADKWVCNFSLFQSLPDIWGLGQTFPIMPLHVELEQPLKDVIIQDITCDSDGRIDQYVTELSPGHVLPVPNQQTNMLAFFLVGAYQETLGDKHNLFGDTNSVNVILEKNKIQLEEAIPGEDVCSVIESIHFDSTSAQETLLQKLDNNNHVKELLNAILHHDCYLNLS